MLTPMMMYRASAVGLLLVLAACSATREPLRAAMVAQASTGDYGYYEKTLAPDRYEVSYISPRLQAKGDDTDGNGLKAERQLVYELALWRAAQLARDTGHPAFKVEQESSDVDVTVQRDLIYPAYSPFFYPHYRRHHYYDYWPYGYYHNYAPSDYRVRRSGRITVALTVTMLAAATDGAFDTAATEERLRNAHAAATFLKGRY